MCFIVAGREHRSQMMSKKASCSGTRVMIIMGDACGGLRSLWLMLVEDEGDDTWTDEF